MSATAPMPPEAAAVSAAEPLALSWFERWSDRLNPILVREVQQAVKGRMFFLAVLAALVVSIGIAIVVAIDLNVTADDGRDVFNAGLACLVPLVLFIVPMQAYQAMRMELRAGIVEQLLLSKLRPWRIVLGKLGTAMVQYFLFLSVLAPVLSLTYLLRGVDLPSIGWSLMFSLVFCLGATACAVSAAAQGVIPGLQPLANLGIAFGLGMGTIGMMVYVGDGEYLRDLGWGTRSAEWALIVTTIVGGTLCGIVLSAMVAASLLTHGFENRSTPFRLFLIGMVVVTVGWVWVFAPPTAMRYVLPGIATFLALLGAGFGIFMVTEPQHLSPRARALAPKSRLLSVLVAALLPGRDRGLLFMILYQALVAGVVGVSWVAAGGMSGTMSARGMWEVYGFTLAYVLIYLCLGRFVRTLLPATPMGGNLGRIAIPLLVMVFTIVPFLFDALVQGHVRGWHVGHALDPFFTIEKFAWRDRGEDVIVGLLILAGVLVALSLPALLRGLAEAAVARQAAMAAAAVAARPAEQDGAA
ncbi:MAG: hypothetical protein IPK26_06685 [Planctomycetes bacterium]|nr:hypothetical protein [Planctomycetota bacterium]